MNKVSIYGNGKSAKEMSKYIFEIQKNDLIN